MRRHFSIELKNPERIRGVEVPSAYLLTDELGSSKSATRWAT